MNKELKKIRLFINKLGNKSRYKKLIHNKVTIISNNCFAGIIYQYLGLPYNSPTVGMYFFPNEYIKFLKNMDQYLREEIKIIPTEESRYFQILLERGENNSIIGKLGDIEINFLHYHSESEIIEKWNRRKERINKNEMLITFNDQNFATYNNLKEFDELPYKNKICMTSKEYPQLKSNVFFLKYCRRESIKEDYYSIHQYLDIVKFINCMKEE